MKMKEEKGELHLLSSFCMISACNKEQLNPRELVLG